MGGGGGERVIKQLFHTYKKKMLPLSAMDNLMLL